MSMQYAIGGYVLPGMTQRRGIWLLEATEYAPALSPRHADLYIPQVHYAVPLWGDPLSAITLTLQVRVQGDNADDLRNLWNTLVGLLGMGNSRPVDITRYRGAYTDTAEAQLLSTSSPDFNCPSNRLTVTIIFNIPGGGWRGEYIEQSFGEEPISANVGEQSTLPIADSLIRVQGSASFSNMEITDITSGTGIAWGDSVPHIPAGKWLLIDPYSMRALRKDGPDWDTTSYDADFSNILRFLGEGPFTITPRSLPSGEREALVSAFSGTFFSLPVVRARSMVA